jgi:hypothetical protein
MASPDPVGRPDLPASPDPKDHPESPASQQHPKPQSLESQEKQETKVKRGLNKPP